MNEDQAREIMGQAYGSGWRRGFNRAREIMKLRQKTDWPNETVKEAVMRRTSPGGITVFMDADRERWIKKQIEGPDN